MEVTLRVDGQLFQVKLTATDAGWQATVGDYEFPLTFHATGGGGVVTSGALSHTVQTQGGVLVDGISADVSILDLHGVAGADSGGTAGAQVRPPMTGKLVKLAVKEGDTVEAGDVLFVLEAMKMANEVRSPATGRVLSVSGSIGETVETDHVIVDIGPAD